MSKRMKPFGDKVDNLFTRYMEQTGASDAARAEEEREQTDHWRETCETLVTSPTFREWFERIMLDAGGMELDRPLADLAQGQMIMLAKLRDSLKTAPSAPRFFGELMEKHYRRLVGDTDEQ